MADWTRLLDFTTLCAATQIQPHYNGNDNYNYIALEIDRGREKGRQREGDLEN